jgi:hypothetical protein
MCWWKHLRSDPQKDGTDEYLSSTLQPLAPIVMRSNTFTRNHAVSADELQVAMLIN